MNGNGNGNGIVLRDVGPPAFMNQAQVQQLREFLSKVMGMAKAEIDAYCTRQKQDFDTHCKKVRGGIEPTPAALLGELDCLPGGGFYPAINLPGCPVNIDTCAFPAIGLDLRLFSWPEIEAQMWDTDTKIDNIIDGAVPLAAGGVVTFEQELRRTLTWIPASVQIGTTWVGPPQQGLLSYRWSSGPKGSLLGAVNFSNPQDGQQYECGTPPNSCVILPFPTYRGADSIAIGALSSLRLTVTANAAMTSTLQKIMVTVYHKKNCKSSCGCATCKSGGTCAACVTA